ncbi:MAG: ABC transporter substrate-binding protein, partial [Oscillospiraceae bacterium]|nr:ABC transporter substrate-binding protein [Oscillospiraceae bacterium]
MDKTNLKKIAAALLALLLLIPAAACGRGGRLSYEERKQRDEELYGAVDLGGINDANALFDTPSPNFTLPYSRTGMSQVDLDPFTCTSTLNDALCHLVYDRLVYIDSEFHIVEAIAQSAEMTTNKMITVILRGIVFSDGSLLTGEDVVYSFEQAKTSLKYKAQLDNFTSCATGETATNIVVFRLEEPDIMAVMNLDFPIIKKFSDRNDPERPSTDPQNAHMPVGSGRYYYYSDIEHGFFLMRNKRWYGKNPTPIDGKKPSPIERISLVGMPSMESIIHSIEIGTVSYYFADLREGFLFKDSSDRPSNRFGGNYVTVDLNNLVFLGLNTF